MPIAPEYLHLVYPGEMPAFIYGRASRDPRKQGKSVAAQVDTGRDLCDEYEWPIVGVFDQDVDRSASRHARKKRGDFDAMIEGIERRECRIVVAFEASRYYRDIEAYIKLRNACMAAEVLLCYNGQIYDLSKREDRKATAMDALQAEDEAEGIRDRVLRTTRSQAKKGAPHGRLLWGYGRKYDPDTGDLIEQYVLPERGPVVVDVFKRVEAGETEYSILQDLKAGGERLPGIPWRYDHLSSMLRNPGYIARRIHQGEDIGPAAWPPISNGVDDEGFVKTFYAVQKIVSDPKRRHTHDTAVKHELSFLALCGVHDAPLKVLKNRHYLSYQCSEAYDTVMRKELLEAYVEEAVIRWLSSPAAADAFRDDEQEKQAEAARARIEYLNGQLAEARGMAGEMDNQGRPKLSIASLASIESRLLPQLEEAQAAADVTSAPPVLRRLLRTEDVEKMWEGLTVTQRRTVLRTIVTIRLHKARARGVRKIEPGRIALAFVGQEGFRPSTMRGAARRVARPTVPAGE